MPTPARHRPLTADDVQRRAAELYAALNIGLADDSPARVYTYGERQPERDHFDLWIEWTDASHTDVKAVAYHDAIDEHRRFVGVYGRRDPACRWAYAVPAGVPIETDEPEGWQRTT